MAVAIEYVVRAKRNHMAAGQHVMRAAFHDAADVEVISVEEAGDRDAEEVFGADVQIQDVPEEFTAWQRPWPAVATAAGIASEILMNQITGFFTREADAVGEEVEVGVG